MKGVHMKRGHRAVKIVPVINGYIVEVGCKSVVFGNAAEMTSALTQYFSSDDPERYEKNFVEVFDKGLLNEPPAQPVADALRMQR
jgi:hypothetical protein